MITTFKVMLLFTIAISFFSAASESQPDKIRSFTAMFITSIGAFIVSVIWL